MPIILDHYGGNAVLATSAYNWGMGHVHRLMGRVGDPRRAGVTDEQFTLSIPVPQAQDYVRRVVYGETWEQQAQGRKQQQQQQLQQRSQARAYRRPPPLL